MRSLVPCILGLSLCVAGCSGNDPATAGDDMPGKAFLRHMHAHATRLHTLDYALANDDLVRASIPAYWLSRHKTVDGIPDDWQPYVVGMRAAAQEVDTAKDLDAARAATIRIRENCQACHDAAGITAKL
jgi:hypothetical protein